MAGRRVSDLLAEAGRTLQAVDPTAVERVADALAEVQARGGTIFVAGNGGSASTATHFACDLQKAAGNGRGDLRAVSLSDNVALLTAWANDVGFDRVFAEQLRALASPGDAFVVISVSGCSPNLLAALEVARAKGLTCIGLLGKDGGDALAALDHAVVVPSWDYGWVESVHVILEHVLTCWLQDATGRGIEQTRASSEGRVSS